MSKLPHKEEKDVLTDVTTQGISPILVKLPNQFQKQLIPHLLSIRHPRNDAQSILLVQGNGCVT